LRLGFLIALGLLACTSASGQQAGASSGNSDNVENDLDHAIKVSDDVLWHLELDDIAEVRTFRYTGLPRAVPRRIQ
jgi:hypothetical protein